MVLSWPQIHRDTLNICEQIDDYIEWHDLTLTENLILTYSEYANLINSAVEWPGVSHQSPELLLYIGQMLAGGVHH